VNVIGDLLYIRGDRDTVTLKKLVPGKLIAKRGHRKPPSQEFPREFPGITEFSAGICGNFKNLQI